MSSLPEPQPLGAPVWVDLSCTDVAASQQFYGEVLGWSFTEPAAEFGGYVRARTADGDVAGLGPVGEGEHPAWTLYFRVADAHAAATAVVEEGGVIAFGPTAVGPLGTMVVGQDPTGAFFGLWENAAMTGFEQYGQVGSMVWTDLRSPEPDAARSFYGPLLGWTFTPLAMAGPSYTTISLVPDQPIGGLGDFMGMEGLPPRWDVYFAVPDVDAAAAAVGRLGGTVVAPPFDTEFGRMCAVVDPQGAAFWIMSFPAR